MGMVKLRPSQNQNPLTDYDKTLHNWLHPRDEHVTQNLCQSTLRERLSKYVKYKALSFFILIFFPDSPTEVIHGRIFTHNDSNYAQSRKEVPFWGLHDDRKHLGGQIPPKPSKLGVNMPCRASQLRVNEDWRHRNMTSLALCSLSVVDYFSTITAKRTVIYAKLLSKCQIIVPIIVSTLT